MSAIASRTSRTWAATHRLLLAVVAFSIALAGTLVIVLTTSADSSSSSSSVSVPTPSRELTDMQKQCQLARVEGC